MIKVILRLKNRDFFKIKNQNKRPLFALLIKIPQNL